MNSPLRHLTLPALVLFAGLTAFTASGCVSAATRMKAGEVASSLETTAAARDQKYEALLRDFVRRLHEARREQALATLSAQKSALQVRVYREFEAERLKLDEEIASQLSTKLNPITSRLLAELTQERQLNAAGKGSREKEQALALQLSATLAETQRRALELSAEASQRLATHRDRLLREIADFPTPAPLATPLSESELNTLFSELSQRGAAYRGELSASREALHRYIAASSPEAPARLFLTGFLGDNLGEKLTAALAGKIDGLNTSLNDATRDVLRKAETGLTDFLKK
jgi:ribosome-binding protein aMBF1 (putative translation factor)